MVYVERNSKNKIVGVYALPQDEGQECLPENNKEIKNFRKDFNDKKEKSRKVTREIIELNRRQAIQNLITSGDLPADYKE